MTRSHFSLPLIALLILWGVAASCSHRARCREAESSFAIAESLMISAPDSALSVAESVDTAGLCPDCFFRWDIIIAKAKNKAYLSLAPDTARLKAAAGHFAGRGDSLEIQSLCYYGFSLYSVDRYSEALIALHDAYDIASATGDHFYAAMSARCLSIIYGDLLIMDRALKWALTARMEFTAAGKPILRNFNSGEIVLQAYDRDGNLVLEEDMPAYFKMLGKYDGKYYGARFRPEEISEDDVAYPVYSFTIR